MALFEQEIASFRRRERDLERALQEKEYEVQQKERKIQEFVELQALEALKRSAKRPAKSDDALEALRLGVLTSLKSTKMPTISTNTTTTVVTTPTPLPTNAAVPKPVPKKTAPTPVPKPATARKPVETPTPAVGADPKPRVVNPTTAKTASAPVPALTASKSKKQQELEQMRQELEAEQRRVAQLKKTLVLEHSKALAAKASERPEKRLSGNGSLKQKDEPADNTAALSFLDKLSMSWTQPQEDSFIIEMDSSSEQEFSMEDEEEFMPMHPELARLRVLLSSTPNTLKT